MPKDLRIAGIMENIVPSVPVAVETKNDRLKATVRFASVVLSASRALEFGKKSPKPNPDIKLARTR